jgi:outer membrane protein
MSRCLWLVLCVGLFAVERSNVLFAQSGKTLTLKEAEDIAVKAHPRLMAAQFSASAAKQVPTQIRSALYPTLYGSFTGALADENTRIAAGGLNNPLILSRLATGLTMGQMITDFGRTSQLTKAYEVRAEAQELSSQSTRARILLQVSRSYFAALRSQGVLRVAEQTVKARQLVADQVSELAKSNLKSGLDVSFANVNLAEAKLLLAAAQNSVEAAFADLSAALGYQERQVFQLTEEPLAAAPGNELSALVNEAIQNRPDLESLRRELSASQHFVEAERDLKLPTIGVVGSVGVAPTHVDVMRGYYGAIGFNVNIPVFNGHLFSARRAEADLKAQAASQEVRDLQNRVVQEVRIAWLDARTSYQRLDLTGDLLNQAGQALDLAQTRYDLGLSSIVELSQAQLNKTSAEISNVSAKYDCQIQMAMLSFQTGRLR